MSPKLYYFPHSRSLVEHCAMRRIEEKYDFRANYHANNQQTVIAIRDFDCCWLVINEWMIKIGRKPIRFVLASSNSFFLHKSFFEIRFLLCLAFGHLGPGTALGFETGGAIF